MLVAYSGLDLICPMRQYICNLDEMMQWRRFWPESIHVMEVRNDVRKKDISETSTATL